MYWFNISDLLFYFLNLLFYSRFKLRFLAIAEVYFQKKTDVFSASVRVETGGNGCAIATPIHACEICFGAESRFRSKSVAGRDLQAGRTETYHKIAHCGNQCQEGRDRKGGGGGLRDYCFLCFRCLAQTVLNKIRFNLAILQNRYISIELFPAEIRRNIKSNLIHKIVMLIR